MKRSKRKWKKIKENKGFWKKMNENKCPLSFHLSSPKGKEMAWLSRFFFDVYQKCTNFEDFKTNKKDCGKFFTRFWRHFGEDEFCFLAYTWTWLVASCNQLKMIPPKDEKCLEPIREHIREYIRDVCYGYIVGFLYGMDCMRIMCGEVKLWTGFYATAAWIKITARLKMHRFDKKAPPGYTMSRDMLFKTFRARSSSRG